MKVAVSIDLLRAMTDDSKTSVHPAKASQFYRQLGQRLLKRRLALELSQQTAAERVAVSVEEIEAVEEGRRPLSAEELCRLCALFEVDVWWPFESLPGVEGDLIASVQALSGTSDLLTFPSLVGSRAIKTREG